MLNLVDTSWVIPTADYLATDNSKIRMKIQDTAVIFTREDPATKEVWVGIGVALEDID